MGEEEKDFFNPITEEKSIKGTSYKLQFGLINENWASRLIKGRNVLETNTYEVEGGFPYLNLVVQWVLRTITIPNINPHQVMRTSESLIEQALEKLKKKASEKIIEKIEDKKKIQSLLKVKLNRLNEKLDILKALDKSIENGATGTEIQGELVKYPRYYTDIFRTYDMTFFRVGDACFKEQQVKETEKESRFKRIDSCENFMKLLNTKSENTQKEISVLESEIEEFS